MIKNVLLGRSYHHLPESIIIIKVGYLPSESILCNPVPMRSGSTSRALKHIWSANSLTVILGTLLHQNTKRNVHNNECKKRYKMSQCCILYICNEYGDLTPGFCSCFPSDGVVNLAGFNKKTNNRDNLYKEIKLVCLLVMLK